MSNPKPNPVPGEEPRITPVGLSAFLREIGEPRLEDCSMSIDDGVVTVKESLIDTCAMTGTRTRLMIDYKHFQGPCYRHIRTELA